MADMDKRLKFYNGQFLQQQDFTDEQAYHLDRLRRHNRQMHTYGVAEGLTVTANVGATSAVVAPGTALDGEGRPIVLTQQRNVSFGSLTNQWVLVVISYAEQPSDPASVGDEGDTRWQERPDIQVIAETGAPAADVRIRLARLQIAANGTVAQHDTAVRTSAGVKLGTEVAIERIRLSRQGVSSNLWPVLTSGAASQADLAGNLNVAGNVNVTGNVVVTGTVDGRDVSVDGAANEAHRNRTDNPHGTTALQVGAITGVGGVLNPGGPVNLQAGNNIAIAVDNTTNKRLTISSATIDGVSNPGGNIDFAGTGGIVVTPDNTNKQIVFNLDLAQSGYLRRILTSAVFSQNDADGATRTISVGFQPRYIIMQGRVGANLNGYLYGGAIGGFCRCDDGGGFYAIGHGPVVTRYVGAPYSVTYNHMNYSSNALCYYQWYDYTSTPSLAVYGYVAVDAVGANSFTLKLSRTTFTGYNAPNFSIDLAFAVIG